MESVSVIMPTYNRANCILKSIKSILEQTYNNFELIIVDDGSTDDTERIVQSIKDERIRYIKMSKNSGPSAARNYGVKNARFNIIAFHDSDDEWVSSKLEMQLDFLESYPSIPVVYTKMRCINNTSGEELQIPNDSFIPAEFRSGRIFPYLLVRNFIGAPTIVLKKDVFNQVGGFDEDMYCLEDWDFVLRISKQYDIGYVDEELYVSYRGNTNSVDASIINHLKSRLIMLEKYKDEYVSFDMLDSVVDEILSIAKEIGKVKEIATIILNVIRG